MKVFLRVVGLGLLLAVVVGAIGLAAAVMSWYSGEASSRTPEQLLATPVGQLEPAGSSEIYVGYLPLYWERSRILFAASQAGCTLIERYFVTNDPDRFLDAVIAAVHSERWSSGAIMPYLRGQQIFFIPGADITLHFADLDRASDRAQIEAEIQHPLTTTEWRYVAVLGIQDGTVDEGGGCSCPGMTRSR